MLVREGEAPTVQLSTYPPFGSLCLRVSLHPYQEPASKVLVSAKRHFMPAKEGHSLAGQVKPCSK